MSGNNKPRVGDLRIMVECMTNLPIVDGEADWDRAEYEETGPYPTIEAATTYAKENDINGVGVVIVEEYKLLVARDGVYGWDYIERWVEGELSWQDGDD